MDGRRRTDRGRMPWRDRARLWVATWGRLVWGTLVIAIALTAIALVVVNGNRSSDRDAARAYQRCEQVRDATSVVAAYIEVTPLMAERVAELAPGRLRRGQDGRLHLQVPDCAAIYPHGRAVSHRYPDVAPLEDADTRDPGVREP